MKKLLSISIIILVGLSLSSCMYGNTTNRDYTVIKETNCVKKSASVKLYFVGETNPSNYEKIGIVEVQADENTSKQELLDHLRHQAREKCADAIIKVEEKYVTRTTGVIFDDKKEEYVALMYTGIAVQTDNFTKTASTTTPHFSQNVKKEEDRDTTVQMVGTCLGIVTVIILLISGND